MNFSSKLNFCDSQKDNVQFPSVAFDLPPKNSPQLRVCSARDFEKLVDKNVFKMLDGDRVRYVPLGVWLTAAPLLWRQGFTGENCIVGVVDSGVDSSHPDLPNVRKHLSYVGDEEYRDLHYHGTHVAGTVGANGLVVGVAPGATIYDYRVFDGKGGTSRKLIESAIRQAAEDGCHVINLSLGGRHGFEGLKNSVDYAKKLGSLVVAAAGNEGHAERWDSETCAFPACYRSVLSVASTNFRLDSGLSPRDAKFSNRNKAVDVCAFGNEVLSTTPLNSYGLNTGTSMACPHISGFASLMHSKMSSFEGPGKRLKQRRTKRGQGKKGQSESRCETLFNLVKTNAVPVDSSEVLGRPCGILDKVSGAGLVTAFPEVPVRADADLSKFCLPAFDLAWLQSQVDFRVTAKAPVISF